MKICQFIFSVIINILYLSLLTITECRKINYTHFWSILSVKGHQLEDASIFFGQRVYYLVKYWTFKAKSFSGISLTVIF